MGIKNIKLIFTGDVDGRGWVGDVKTMLLDISRLKALGWKPKFDSKQAIKKAVRELLGESA